MSQQKPRQRGGRVLDKATPEQVMGLARNLPLTHSVLEKALADATPGQLGFLANLFEKENASRAESKRRRLLKQAGFPQSKTLEGYDRGMASFPADRGREQLESLEFCACSIESGPCERVDVFHVSGRFWSTSACGEKRTPARPAWTSFPS